MLTITSDKEISLADIDLDKTPVKAITFDAENNKMVIRFQEFLIKIVFSPETPKE